MRVSWKQVAAGLVAMAVGALAAVLVLGHGQLPTNRIAIEQVVRDTILAHPELIPEAMDKLQAKQTAEVVDQNRKAIETPFAGATAGNPGGDVTVVEFADYACGFCRSSVADVERLIAEDKGVKLVFRALPILSAESEVAAKVGLVAAKQGRFYGFHKALYAAGPLTPASVSATAASQGVANANELGEAPDIAAELADNLALARALRLSGTPTFVIGERVLNGAVGYGALKQAVADARAQKPG
jgi:protein-disulfide isomerase